MMMRALLSLAMQKGIEVKTSAAVTGFEEDADGVAVQVSDPFRGEVYSFRCQRMVVCTNAFTKTLLPTADVTPGRGQVLVTEPVPGLKFKGIYHFDKGYYYFREIDGRVLFGGGRNLDFETETTTDFSLNNRIQDDLEEKLKTIILPGTTVAIAHRWAGIMAFGPTKRPIVQAFTNRVFGGFRMGGMGVALGSQTAAQVAQLVAEREA
jgi:glycine/D-amino acid oxidase-like deaminating enzyme